MCGRWVPGDADTWVCVRVKQLTTPRASCPSPGYCTNRKTEAFQDLGHVLVLIQCIKTKRGDMRMTNFPGSDGLISQRISLFTPVLIPSQPHKQGEDFNCTGQQELGSIYLPINCLCDPGEQVRDTPQPNPMDHVCAVSVVSIHSSYSHLLIKCTSDETPHSCLT